MRRFSRKEKKMGDLEMIEKNKELEEKRALYRKKNEYLGSFYEEVEPEEFYRTIFPDGTFERKGVQEDKKPNGILLEFHEGKKNIIRETITDDLEGLLRHRDGFTIYSPISYYGNRRTAVNARFIYALVFDLDGVEMKHLYDLLHQMKYGVIPTPTYLVNSGTGFHLYYVLKDPVPMYPQNRKYLGVVKKALTNRIWNDFTSKYRDKQQQGIMQGFRVIGTRSKLGEEYPVIAYQLTQEYDWTIENFLKFVPESHLKEVKLLEKQSNMTLEEAKRRYPDWYARRVEQALPRGRWVVKRALYDWWLKKIAEEIQVGHRYFAVMILAIFAVKCNIDEDELHQDAFELEVPYEKLTIESSNHFRKADIVAALEMYNEDYVTFPRREIVKLSGLDVPANKRNFRRQEEHLKRARAVQDLDYPTGEWRGRRSKEEEVKLWREKNPKGKKIDCIKETGLAKMTVYKHWGL